MLDPRGQVREMLWKDGIALLTSFRPCTVTGVQVKLECLTASLANTSSDSSLLKVWPFDYSICNPGEPVGNAEPQVPP